MNRIIYTLLLHTLLSTFLNAKEPFLAILVDVTTNSTQRFTYGNYSFNCVPYGIITLEQLYQKSAPDSVCKKSVAKFYRTHPDLEYFTQELMKVQQRYHIEFKKQECIIYAMGQKTLSEVLLENGLALNRPRLKDEEFEFLYTKAQNRAMLAKKGLWGEHIKKDCVSELNKD
jgi:hypothetical protein